MNEFQNIGVHDNWGHIYFLNMFVIGMSHHLTSKDILMFH